MAECYRKDATFYENNFSRECKNQVNTRRNSVSMKIAKAIFIGEASVGKTSLVMRYTHNAFDLNYKATIGVDFEVEKYSILQVPFTLQMWDTGMDISHHQFSFNGPEVLFCVTGSEKYPIQLVLKDFNV